MNGFVVPPPYYIAYLCIRQGCHLNKPEVYLVLNSNNHNIHCSAQHTVVRLDPVCKEVDDWAFHAFFQIYFFREREKMQTPENTKSLKKELLLCFFFFCI